MLPDDVHRTESPKIQGLVTPAGLMASFFNKDMQEVTSGAVSAFILRALGAFVTFLLNIEIARLFGANGAGTYFLALTLLMFSSVLSSILP